MAYTAAKPAAFAPAPRRRTLIGMVHIAPKQLNMDDDDYRAVMLRVTGRLSAKDCTEAELERLVAEFRRLGFSAAPRKAGGARRADHPLARKARVMWISLAHLCAVREEPDAAIRADKGLEAFARRQLQCTRFQWADQNKGEKLVEALKKWAERHGWDQSQGKLPKVHYVHALKVRLCFAILAKLKRAGLADENWTLGQAAFRLCGLGASDQCVWATQELEHIAVALGRHLRQHGGQGVFAEVVQ
ncbi:MAG: gp16 family protein [Sphingobium sp.]